MSKGETMSLLPLSLPTFEGADEKIDTSQWLDRGIIAAVLLACAVALSLNAADHDLWGHIQYGRDALRHGLPATTTYSYIAAGYPWINHEILAEYALAIGTDWFGATGLLLGKCLLGVAIVGVIMWRAKRQEVSFISLCSFTLLIAATLGGYWTLRPQLASYACFILLLALLSYCFEGWDGKWQLSLTRWLPNLPLAEQLPTNLEYSLPRLKLLWLAPPLFMIWTNAHGGFLAGLAVYLAYLTFRGVEAVSQKGRAADGLVVRFGLMGAAAVAATFLNPYGPGFHRWLLDDLKVPRPEIVEWRAPELFNGQFLPFWLLMIACIAAFVVTRRSRDFTQIAILALILWQALSHHRHIAFFALACGWWLPVHFDSLLARLGINQRFKTDEELKYGWAPPDSSAFSACFSPQMQIGLAVGLATAICISTFQLSHRLTTLRVDRSAFPVGAAVFIADRGLTGKMVCTFNWAQYALAAFGAREPGDPGIQLHVDGRCRTSFSQAMLDSHFDFLLGELGPSMRYRDPKSGPFDPARVLNEGRPDLVLISRLQEPSVAVMEGEKERWVLLYQDSLAQLWGRKSRYDDPNSAFYLEPRYREVGQSMQQGFVYWPALPQYAPAAPREISPTAVADNAASPAKPL